ncbi:MAG: prepilin-type N-terminal cleavage/methylation domain-containing protein [Deltaproteobacteria bacterium]|uniref:pilus assembly FimT family protein n=1 Tax=Desulfobacula sp. TaxID=2593537 RepID=UPI0019A8C418|nr:prepilin-type N-terminal cleavage/methylation domain-containing protein [Candidatus Desulfobacula maris]MBL6993204.1 prepilin-type N-terminal cleavage/methylation domain-containing protein [Desulfobacula sp.]
MAGSSIKKNGFTLIELLVIVMILGILLMAGVPALTSVMADSKLSSAGTIMVSAIEYTASLSIKYKRPFQFEADVNNNFFQIKDTAPYPDPDPDPGDPSETIRLNNLPPVNGDDIVFNPLAGTWYIVDFDTTGNFDGVSIDSGPAALKFFPDGHSAYTDSQYVLSLGELSNTITINGITGRITVD